MIRPAGHSLSDKFFGCLTRRSPGADRDGSVPAAAPVRRESRKPTARVIRMARLASTRHFLEPQPFEARVALPSRLGQPGGELVEGPVGDDEALWQPRRDLLALRWGNLPSKN